ncbi:alanine racemase [Mediterraneibacter agrestimuris]|uniref:alanine racemase n=1 Tax=Mediterraneibacter agrestimuris TaxID=2941333 RepID=UPI00203C598C|nr:alanine racemase [Mediterraneibacter agrestimuris]
MKQYNRVYASINLDAIAYNMEQMEKRIGGKTQIMVVIKSDGYGHGAVPIAELSEEVDYVWGYATASLDEAKVLREAGIKKPILVLGCVFPDQYEDMINFDIRGAVYTWEMAQGMADAAKKLGKTAVVHIKIDTGMGRIGFKVDEESADIIRDIWQMNHISVEGLFTHFSKADETDKSYTKMQHDKFVWMKQALQERGVEIPYLNCDNSAGIIDFPDLKHDLVRAGISLYGMYPSDEVEQEVIDLHPALELISHVTFVKDIEAGTAISYGGTFVSEKPMRVATIPVGYGDGYPRSLSNKGEVLIRGRRARILGRVCMDQFIVDVTDIPDVQFMDRVTLVGRDGEEHICVEELSELSGRFNYEFVCCLSKRIPRVYTKGGNVVIQKDCF